LTRKRSSRKSSPASERTRAFYVTRFPANFVIDVFSPDGLNGKRASSSGSSANNLVAEKDILRCLCGLISIGKIGFDHIRQFRENEYFAEALGVDRMSSEATLRRRLEVMSQDPRIHGSLPGCSVRMLRKVGFKPQTISVPGFVGVRIDTDATILDNSDTKKEGVERAYNGISGYAPVCSFLAGGVILGAELRPGIGMSCTRVRLSTTREFGNGHARS